MAGPSDKRWRTPPRWVGGLTAFVDRRMDRLAGGSERSMAITEGWLDRSRRRWGPDSWKTVNVMEATAKRKDEAGDHQGALPLRRQVLAKRQEHLGADNMLTVSAEFALSGTLVGLERYDEARPLVEHAFARRVQELGPDDPSSLVAQERRGRIQLMQGETTAGMHTYEQAIAGFRSRGDQVAADRATTNLGRILLGSGLTEEALSVFRDLVDAQSRVLGTDDPTTLRSRRDLALTLARMGRLFEAKVIADGIVAASTRVLGADDPATAAARALLAKVEDSLPPD